MPTLPQQIDALERLYGAPSAPIAIEPFAQILWESVAYLASDARRAEAFALLERSAGLTPQAILRASDASLLAVTKLGGIHPELRAERLREIAEIAHEEFDDNLAPILQLPLKAAKKSLQRFPMIGEPGAEKILLVAGAYPLMALDSNGLRALIRLGYGEERKSYSATYRSAQTAAAVEIEETCGARLRAMLVLRTHGQECCKNARPNCAGCVLKQECGFFQRR